MDIEKDFKKILDNAPEETLEHYHRKQQKRAVNYDGAVFIEYLFDDDDFFLAERFARKVRAETSWFENIIKHQPSVGLFYENLLKTTLNEFSPSNIKIGTGFVFDADKKKDSPQIDIILYQDHFKSPIYKNGDFVIVAPEQVVSVSEVKKSLKQSDINNIVQKTLLVNHGMYPFYGVKGVQHINIFAFRAAQKSVNIVNRLLEQINLKLSRFSITAHPSLKSLPIFYLTLPNIYFFDRNEIIETRVKTKHNRVSTIEIISYSPFKGEMNKNTSTDSLAEFLLKCISDNTHYINPTIKSNLSSSFANWQIESKRVESIEFNLYDRLSMFEISRHYSSYTLAKQSFLVNGREPHAVYIPKGFDWMQYNYEDLIKNDFIFFDFI